MKKLILALALMLFSVPAFAQSAFDDLKAIRRNYPTPMSKAQLGAMLNEVAWKHRLEGYGLQRKTGGDTCPQPVTNIQVSCDILRLPGNLGMDVLGDADGAANPQWGGAGPADPATFVAPVDVAPAPVPTPTPDPEPPPTTGAATADLQQQQLVLLLQIIQKLEEQNAALTKGLADLRAEIGKGVKVRF